MRSTSELWFLIFVAIFIFVTLVVSVINLFIYNDISRNTVDVPQSGSATFMFWVQMILFILGIGLFIWVIIILLFSRKHTKIDRVKRDEVLPIVDRRTVEVTQAPGTVKQVTTSQNISPSNTVTYKPPQPAQQVTTSITRPVDRSTAYTPIYRTSNYQRPVALPTTTSGITNSDYFAQRVGDFASLSR